jgi:glycosidase
MKAFVLILQLVFFIPNIALTQMPHQRIALDGQWLFKPDSARQGINRQWYLEEFNKTDWQAVDAPAFWEYYPGLANFDGWGWYARSFELPAISESLSVHFAGVDDDAVVWINGIEVGSHVGYSDPFAVEITSALRSGKNHIVVQVLDYGGGGGIYKPITIIETRYLDELIKSEYSELSAIKSADWVREAIIYEVYLRSFSKEGTFAALEKRIPELKELGVTVLWIMPIHPTGMKNRKGSLGSPYSIRDYYDVNPEFGTLNDFKRLVNAVHKHGMKIIIDLVINHTSWDSKLYVEHPEWFTRDSNGDIVPPNADWTDVADLDYTHPGLRKYMQEMMVYWVRDIGIDGYRCDVAELVPTDFWDDVRKRLNAVKPVMMLSEGSIPEHHVRAFDLTYAWNIYDALDPLLQEKRPVALLDQILKTESLQFPKGSLRLRFNTNHDKNAWDAPAVEKFGPGGQKLSTVLVNTLPGVPLIYTGEEVANDKRLDLFEKVEVDWNRPKESGRLYKRLFKLRKENRALTRGEMIRVSSSHHQSVFAFARVAGRDRMVAVLNFSSDPLTTTLTVSENQLVTFAGSIFQDIFSDRTIEFGSDGKATIDLPEFGYAVFVRK